MQKQDMCKQHLIKKGADTHLTNQPKRTEKDYAEDHRIYQNAWLWQQLHLC